MEVKTINDIAQECLKTSASKGFTDGDIDRKLLLAVGEIIEAQNELREGHKVDEIYFSKDKEGNDKPEGFVIEVADCIIRLFHLSAQHGLNIQSAIEVKMAYNKIRPYKHGKQF